MRAGLLRERIVIKYKSVTKNTFGEEVITWVALATVWAAVEPLSGRELLEGQSLDVEITTRIRLRYRAGIVPEMLVVHDTHSYNIRSVINSFERKRELVLLCDEVL